MRTKESEELLKMSDGFNIFARRWSPIVKAEKAVVCIHGLGGHSACFVGIGRSLAAFGIEVWGLDLRGFGNSKEPDLPRGDTRDFNRHLQDLNEAVNLIRNSSQSQKLFMLGHSLGGLYVLWYGAKHPDSLDGLILAAPAVEVKSKMSEEDSKRFAFLVASSPETIIDTWNAWPNEIKGNGGKGEKTRVNRLLITTDFSVRYFLGLGMVLMGEKVFANAAHVKKPTLILQGEADEEALPSGARRLFESLANDDKTLKLIPGADHMLHNTILAFPSAEENAGEKEQVLIPIRDWLKSH